MAQQNPNRSEVGAGVGHMGGAGVAGTSTARSPASLRVTSSSGVIDEDSPDHLRAECVEAAAVLTLDSARLHDPEIGLVSQRAGLYNLRARGASTAVWQCRADLHTPVA
jgi:hypothetical protein